MKRTFKYYLKLNKVKKQEIERILKTCCWFNNFLLEKYIEKDKKGEKQLTEYQLINSIPQIKKDNPVLKQLYSTTLQEIAKEVCKRWKKYKELKKLDDKKGYPKFKPLHRYNSFINSQLGKERIWGFDLDNSPLAKKKEARKLTLSLGRGNSKIGVKITMERNIESKIKTLTIKRKNGKYYVCFSCDEIQPKPLPITNQNVGMDVNLNKKSYITLSNGKKYKHPQHYKKSEKKLIQASKTLSSKVEKSKNWKDAKLQLAKKWEKVVNQSKYYSRQVANELVRDYDNIAIEDLRIKNMVKNRTLSKSISQARWGILFQVISEAAEIATRRLVRVNPRNTTQTCSDCGKLAQVKLTLNQRVFECWNCELELDRDVNSARNILNLAETGSTRTLLEKGKNIFVL